MVLGIRVLRFTGAVFNIDSFKFGIMKIFLFAELFTCSPVDIPRSQGRQLFVLPL
jgi:hypothetical protein